MKTQLRCTHCKKLLAVVSGKAHIEIKCTRCKTMNITECRERQSKGDSNVETSSAVAGRQTQTGKTHPAHAG